jgi:hypothetical protein
MVQIYNFFNSFEHKQPFFELQILNLPNNFFVPKIKNCEIYLKNNKKS